MMSKFKSFVLEIYIAYAQAKAKGMIIRKSSFLGEVWILAEPAVMAIVFTVLYSLKVIPIENLGMSFGFFIVTGFLVWQLFNDSLIDGIELLNYNKVFANSVTISNYSILLALIIFRLKFIFYHTFIMLILCFSYYGYFDILQIIPFLISIAIITLLGLGIGLCISPFAWFLGDLNKGLRLTLRPLMFVSGVVFPMGATSFSQYAESNPINILIDWSRIPFADTANMLIDVSAGLHFSLFISISFFVIGIYITNRTLRYVYSQ